MNPRNKFEKLFFVECMYVMAGKVAAFALEYYSTTGSTVDGVRFRLGNGSESSEKDAAIDAARPCCKHRCTSGVVFGVSDVMDSNRDDN